MSAILQIWRKSVHTEASRQCVKYVALTLVYILRLQTLQIKGLLTRLETEAIGDNGQGQTPEVSRPRQGNIMQYFKPGFHSNAIVCFACVACVAYTKTARNASIFIGWRLRKRQPIGMLVRSSGNHDWLLANASACVSCGFRLRNARNSSDRV